MKKHRNSARVARNVTGDFMPDTMEANIRDLAEINGLTMEKIDVELEKMYDGVDLEKARQILTEMCFQDSDHL